MERSTGVSCPVFWTAVTTTSSDNFTQMPTYQPHGVFRSAKLFPTHIHIDVAAAEHKLSLGQRHCRLAILKVHPPEPNRCFRPKRCRRNCRSCKGLSRTGTPKSSISACVTCRKKSPKRPRNFPSPAPSPTCPPPFRFRFPFPRRQTGPCSPRRSSARTRAECRGC